MSQIDKNTRDEAITFFVAECMEFHQAGVMYENIPTIEEAIEIYKKLPANKKHLGNGIGAMVDDWEYSLFEGGMVDTLEYYEDAIKTNPEIMGAMQTLTNYVAEKEQAITILKEPEQAKGIIDDKERKIAIFQKERTRTTFILNEQANNYNVTTLTLLGTGASSTRTTESKEVALDHTMYLITEGYKEFRNPKEVSWYATVGNNTPYNEKWEVDGRTLIPMDSHSVGITTFNGRSYSTVDEWANGTENYILGRDVEDNNFFYARVVSHDEVWKGVYTYEYDGQPTRKDVEDNYLDDISMRDIDRHEAEYGADGRRAFPHLNDFEEITLHLKYQEPYVINGYVVETDTIAFSDIESMNAFIKGEVSYDFLDNTVKKRENEILLYAENKSGKVIWDNREVERVDLPRQIEYRNKEHHIVLRQQYKQGNNHLFSDDNDYLYEIFQGTVNGGELHLFLRTDEEKILFSGKLDKDYEEFKVSLATVRLSDYSFATLAQRNDLVLPLGISYETLLHREETESFVYGEWAKENTAPVSVHTQGIVHDLVMDKDISDVSLEGMIWDVLETYEKTQKQDKNINENKNLEGNKMMNYEVFKDVVAEKFKEFMPEEYKDYKVDVSSVTKVNQSMDMLKLVSPMDDSSSASPNIQIGTMYEYYKKCEDLQEVLEKSAAFIVDAFAKAPNIASKMDFSDTAKDNIVMVLVNTEQNKGMLENTPSRQFQDLSIIYKLVVDQDKKGIASTMVTNNIAEILGMNEEQLYNAAVENTVRLFPPTVESMNDVIRNMMMADGMPGEIVDMMIGEVPEDKVMYVISNDRGINGAASMLYEENLHKVAEKLESDLYIMPSSLHEVIAVSVNMGDPNELAQMVNEINMGNVSLDERLSNQVYHYDKDLRKLSLATDTPNKRLDGILAEPQLIYETKQDQQEQKVKKHKTMKHAR